jgi:hypothetical protein
MNGDPFAILYSRGQAHTQAVPHVDKYVPRAYISQLIGGLAKGENANYGGKPRIIHPLFDLPCTLPPASCKYFVSHLRLQTLVRSLVWRSR